MAERRPFIEYFMEKIVPEPNSGCWIFTGVLDRYGYGKTKRARKTLTAHRAMYELAKGQIPDGMTLDHKCRVRCCVNPDHLEVVTQRENMLRGIAARITNRTHCKNGHPVGDKNLSSGNNRWDCRICTNDSARRYRDRKKLALS